MLQVFSSTTLIYAAILFTVAAFQHFLGHNTQLQFARVFCQTHRPQRRPQ